MAELTEKQKRFADYYIESGNATDAYRRAYNCSENTANNEGHKNLVKPCVKAYIDERIASKDEERIAKQDEVLEFLSNVLRGKVVEEVPLGEGGGVQKLVHKELEGKDRIKAAELLGKRYGIWTDTMKLGGNLGVTIVDDIK